MFFSGPITHSLDIFIDFWSIRASNLHISNGRSLCQSRLPSSPPPLQDTYAPPREAIGRITRDQLRELVESEGKDDESLQQQMAATSQAVAPGVYASPYSGLSGPGPLSIPQERTTDLLLLFLVSMGLIGASVFYGVPFLQQLQSSTSLLSRRRDAPSGQGSFPSLDDPLLRRPAEDDGFTLEGTEVSINHLLRRPVQTQVRRNNSNTGSGYSSPPPQTSMPKRSPGNPSTSGRATSPSHMGAHISNAAPQQPRPSKKESGPKPPNQNSQPPQRKPSPTPPSQMVGKKAPTAPAFALIPDTNAFIKDLKTIAAMKGLRGTSLALPGVVVSELEGLQQSTIPDVAFHAREALRFIRTELSAADLTAPSSPLESGSGWVQTARGEGFAPPADHRDLPEEQGARNPSQLRLGDLEVLSFALRIKREYGGTSERTKTVLLTSDKGLQIRALMSDIEAMSPAGFVKHFHGLEGPGGPLRVAAQGSGRERERESPKEKSTRGDRASSNSSGAPPPSKDREKGGASSPNPPRQQKKQAP